MVANGQQPTVHQYDAASRFTRAEQGALFTALGYDNANRRTSLNYSNNTTTSYAYDLASRLTGITHNGPSGVIDALTYQYDAAGNRVTLTRGNGTASLLPTAVASATYDAANEPVRFNSATPNLTYDPNGNVLSQADASGTTTYTWDGCLSGGLKKLPGISKVGPKVPGGGKKPPKMPKNWVPPIDPPQHPPIPPGATSGPTNTGGGTPPGYHPGYPNGYWVQTNSQGRAINPATGKQGTHPAIPMFRYHQDISSRRSDVRATT